MPEYDIAHYLAVLHTSFVARLRKAYAPHVYEQLFRLLGQMGLFDAPIEGIQPQWIPV